MTMASGAIPLENLRARGSGIVKPRADGLLLITPLEQWSYAAELELDAEEGLAASRLLTISMFVQQGILGFGLLKKDGSDWVARHSIQTGKGMVEARLLISPRSPSANLVFENRTANGTPAQALITEIRMGEVDDKGCDFGFDPTRVEIQTADSMIERGRWGVVAGPQSQAASTTGFRTYRAKDAVVFGQPAVFGLRHDGRLICLEESVNNSVFIRSRLDEALELIRRQKLTTSVKIPSACLLDGHWADNIWHWFLEWVVKAVVLEEGGFDGAYLVPRNSPVYRQSLELLGIAPERVMPRFADCFLVDQLSFTEQITGQTLFLQHPWILHRLRRRLRKNRSSHRRLYIARRGIRSVINQDEIAPILERHRFETVYMEDHSIEQQILMASEAEMIAGPHGAGMAFGIFIQEGGCLIEMFSSDYVNPGMLAVCTALDLNYYMLTSRKSPPGTFVNDLVEVDPQLLELTLRNAHARRRAGPDEPRADVLG